VFEGITTPGDVALVSRALAVGNAEQAASRSNAADQATVVDRDKPELQPLGVMSTYLVE
jgi:hypothetical protein